MGVRFLRPFWDPDVVEMLWRTPPQILNDNGRSKGLVRGVLARRFPALGFERQRKVTATSFYMSLLLRDGTALIDAVGDFPALSALGVVDGRAAREFARQALKRRDRRLPKLMPLFHMEAWVRSQMQSSSKTEK